MTITDTPQKYRYEGNGITDTFAFPAKAFSADDIVVEIITRATDELEDTLTITTDYAITIATAGTASITVTAPNIPSSLQDIQIRRALSQTQDESLPIGSPFPAKIVENAIDRVVGLLQDLDEVINRSVKYSVTSSVTEAVMPDPVDDAVVCFDGVTGLLKTGASNAALLEVESNASDSATAAAASASTATTQAGNASASATNASASATAAAASAALAANAPTISSASTSITISSATHKGKYLRTTSGSAVTITLPNDTNDASMTTDSEGYVFQAGAGQVHFVPDSGVTINAEPGTYTAAQYASACWKKVASNTYDLFGHLST